MRCDTLNTLIQLTAIDESPIQTLQERVNLPVSTTGAGEVAQAVQHDSESLLDTDAAGIFLSVSRQTLEQWRCLGKGPGWIRFSRGFSVFPVETGVRR